MQGWIGWYDAGHVDRLGREAIATEFFHVVIPIWPRRWSAYQFVTPAGERGELQIPQDRRSVVLGLTRTPAWLATVIVGMPVVVDPERWSVLLPFATALCTLAGLLTFAFGRLSEGERERRALLHRATGLGAPPELLPEAMLQDIRSELAEAWSREYQSDWRDAIHAGVASEVLVALADYHRAPQLLIRARTNLIDRGGN
jgi:hypothetical protein